MSRILVVEDDRSIREAIEVILNSQGHSVQAFRTAEEALAQDGFQPDLLITDYKLPAMNGIDLIAALKKKQPQLESIVITAYGRIELAVEAVKHGATDFLTKPFSPDELMLRVDKLLDVRQAKEQRDYLLEEVRKVFSDYEIIGSSEEMKRIYSLVTKVARSESTVLIHGESGTGKELIARFIHFNSRRSSGPFIKVNCAALAEGILESELFGHEKGAFTGSVRLRKGRFELAHQGTIFLDEIGDLAPAVQVKLLRVLQEGEVERVGGEETLKVNVRVLAATNRDLNAMIQKGAFREDLYYRLNVIPVVLPPLRRRKEDIPELIQFFLRRLAGENKRNTISLDKEATQALLDYPWPGNIRELENVLERAVVLCDSDHITLNDLPFIQETSPTLEQRTRQMPDRGNLDDRLAEMEKLMLVEALQEAKGIKTRAARALGIKTSTLYYKLEKYGLIALILSFVFCGNAFAAETTQSLAAKLEALNSEIATADSEYQKEKKRNSQLVSKSANSEDSLKEAYASAETLNALTYRLNSLEQQQAALCKEWRTTYAADVDALLARAASVADPKKKGAIGKQLRELQKQNQQFCAENSKIAVSEEWRSVQIESYDGPQEIRQKIVLLQDVSREINIHLAQMDQQLENYRKERKTKERAEEFIEESTLFTDNISVRRGEPGPDTMANGPTSEIAQPSAEVIARGELYSKEQSQQFELQHRQKKAQLLSQQRDLQKKISEFETRANQLNLP